MNLFRNGQTISHGSGTTLHSHQQKLRGFQLSHILANTCYFSSCFWFPLLIIAIQVDANQYLVVDFPLFWYKACVCVCVFYSLSHVQLFATPWNAARQAPMSTGPPGQEYWSGLPSPSPGNLPNPGIETASAMSPTLQADSLPLSPRQSYCLKY